MAAIEDEEELLRSVALQNARSILLARQRAEEALRKQTEWLRITLASIGDAVISTDAEGRVTFLNGVAEALTGWPEAEAVGRALADVFRVLHERTRQPVENPALRALRDGAIVNLANHTLLVARDGTERPIDDSAAPMRDGSNAIVGAVLVFRDVTESSQADAERERLLGEVETGRERLAEVFRRSPSFMAILRGPEQVVELTNDRFNQLVGHRQILGKPVRRALPEIEGQGFFDPLDRVFRTGQAFASTEMRLRVQREPDRPLEERFVEFVYQPLRDPDGSVSGILVHGIDLTDRKRAEAAVRQRDDRLQLFLGNATDYAIIMTDAEGRILEWKGGAEQITGWSEDEVLGTTADVVFTLEDRAAGVPLEERRKAEEVGRAEDKRWHLRKDGSRFFADGVMTSLRGPDGELQGFGKVLRDVTERKRNEEVLSRDALLLANVRDSVVVTDLEGIVTYWNEGATRLFGWTAEEMLGRPYADRYPEPARAQIRARLQARLGGVDWSGEFEDYRKDGSRVWIDARVSRVRDSAGRPMGILGLAHDVTDRKAAEDALREADRRKDEFLAILAHELRNPLAPLRNGLEVMRLASADAGAVAEARDMMDRQLGHMVRLIDDLLDISRISRDKMELRRQPVTLAEVVSNSVETARPLIESAGHEFTVDVSEEPVILHVDLTRVAQVLANLLANSAKYTPRGGRIWLAAEKDGDEVVISIRDTGIGIPTAELPRIFGMFSQVDRSIERAKGGLGIGLALVKALVEMHGGTVTAESEGIGRGSTFTVRLPLTQAVPDAVPATPPQEPARRSRIPKRILVVDDNEDSALSMARVLRLLKNEVRTAHDGYDAIEVANEFRPDAILMDLGMPGLNGYEATRRIRDQPWAREVVIIALTGWGQDADRLLSNEAGCNGHLVKPVNLTELERLLGELTTSEGDRSRGSRIGETAPSEDL